ncbi:MAG: cell division protein FtsZ [Methylobacterium sp.]|nr:cell division protein FtsZ [Methylobacterium sp.]
MSDLQLGLLALGAVVIAAVILFNWWQERRFSRDSIRRFEGPADDALLEEFRIDAAALAVDAQDQEFADASDDASVPTGLPAQPDEELPPVDEAEPRTTEAFDASFPYTPTANDDPDAWQPDSADPEPAAPLDPETPEAFFKGDSEAVPDVFAAPAAPAEAVGTGPEPAGRVTGLPETVDLQIDLVGLVSLNLPRTGSTLRQELQPLPDFDKPVQWLGLDDGGHWRHLTRDQESAVFSRVACSLQMADRSGPVSLNTLRNFQVKVDDVASKLGSRVEWHDHDDPYRYAQELDAFCVAVDVMVGFHVIQGGNGPFTGTKLRGVAEAGGMSLGEDGNFHCRSESGDTLFMLVNQDQRPFSQESLRSAFVRGVSFQLDVPRVKNCIAAFNQMALLARQMESSLAGRLVDDNQRPLGDAEIDKIRQQLKQIYARMVARGVIPGSASANRLFS